MSTAAVPDSLSFPSYTSSAVQFETDLDLLLSNPGHEKSPGTIPEPFHVRDVIGRVGLDMTQTWAAINLSTTKG